MVLWLAESLLFKPARIQLIRREGLSFVLGTTLLPIAAVFVGATLLCLYLPQASNAGENPDRLQHYLGVSGFDIFVIVLATIMSIVGVMLVRFILIPRVLGAPGGRRKFAWYASIAGAMGCAIVAFVIVVLTVLSDLSNLSSMTSSIQMYFVFMLLTAPILGGIFAQPISFFVGLLVSFAAFRGKPVDQLT